MEKNKVKENGPYRNKRLASAKQRYEERLLDITNDSLQFQHLSWVSPSYGAVQQWTVDRYHATIIVGAANARSCYDEFRETLVHFFTMLRKILRENYCTSNDPSLSGNGIKGFKP